MGWQHNPQPPQGPHGPQAQQHLSVVTTVWGVSSTTQTGPINHTSFSGGSNQTPTSMAPTPYSQQQGFPSGGPQKTPYNPQNMPYRQPGPNYNT